MKFENKFDKINAVIQLLNAELVKYNVSLHRADTGSAYFRFPFSSKVKMIRVGDHNMNSTRAGVWELRSDAMTKRYKGRRIYNLNDVTRMLSDLEQVMK